MSRYQGGKNRNGKGIVDAMEKIIDTLIIRGHLSEDFQYVEPFMGMAGVLRHVVARWPCHKIIASDKNPGVVRMWQKLVKTKSTDFLPKSPSLAKFLSLKKNAFRDDSLAAVRGFYGHALSFGGAYFSGYVGNYDSSSMNSVKRDYLNQSKKAISKVLDILLTAKHLQVMGPCSYEKYKSKKGCVFYCDPPYLRNKECSRNPLYQKFDHDAFWKMMLHLSKTNLVFVSEEIAPTEDWVSIHSSIVRRSHNHYSAHRNKLVGRDNTRTRRFDDRVFVHKRWAKLAGAKEVK